MKLAKRVCQPAISANGTGRASRQTKRTTKKNRIAAPIEKCHATQLRTRRYVELQIARARLLGLTSGVEYAQALYVTSDLLVNKIADLSELVVEGK